MRINSVSVLKHPLESVWVTIRDRLPEVVPLLDDIESVTVESRKEFPDGQVHLVNIWKANPKLPAIVKGYIKTEMLAWTDRAEYRQQSHECVWKMEPHFLAERIKCSGVTRYEPAMGGRGTRVTFESDLVLSLHNLAGVPSILEGPIANAVELFVAALLPKNFRKLLEAAGTLLSTAPASVPAGRPRVG